jgi:ankyrin repeat protein
MKLLLAHPDIDPSATSSGMSVADWCISSDDPDAVRLLFSAGVRFPGTWKLAISRGNPEMVKCLLDLGVFEISDRDENGGTPLHFACEYEALAALDVILQRGGFNVNAQDGEGRTALHCAVANGFVEIVKVLVGIEGIDLSIEDADRVSFLVRIPRLDGHWTGMNR